MYCFKNVKSYMYIDVVMSSSAKDIMIKSNAVLKGTTVLKNNRFMN